MKPQKVITIETFEYREWQLVKKIVDEACEMGMGCMITQENGVYLVEVFESVEV